jgi:hypothetical protein
MPSRHAHLDWPWGWPGLLSPWDWTATDWAGVTCVVLIAAAIVAWRHLREARQLREQQARPFVVIDLDIKSTIAQFEITNIGSTIARDVRFRFEPPLKSSWDDEPGRKPLAQANLFMSGIPSLPPGKVITTMFDQIPNRIAKELPSDYAVQVSYRDAFGKTLTDETTVGYGPILETSRLTTYDINESTSGSKIS